MTELETLSGGGTTGRDRSVARVLDPARQRAEQRVQRFMDAALELLLESGRDFTLQEVVERSGLSLRSFYQHFGGKHELMLALLEDSVRSSAEELRRDLAGVADPLERLHVLVVGYYLLTGRGDRARVGETVRVPVLSEFTQSLLAEHPLEAGGAFRPVHALFEEVLQEAVTAGAVRATPRVGRRAAFLLQTVNFNAYVTTALDSARRRGDDRESAEELWDLLLHGLQAG